jgi:hypothetical protein
MPTTGSSTWLLPGNILRKIQSQSYNSPFTGTGLNSAGRP